MEFLFIPERDKMLAWSMGTMNLKLRVLFFFQLGKGF